MDHVTKKKCPTCGENRPQTDYGSNRARRDGLSYACRPCTRTQNDRWRAESPDAARKNAERLERLRVEEPRRYLNYRYRTMWGITLARYEEILAEQGGGCAVCGRPDNPDGGRLAVDHDHDCCTGKGSCGSCVRGILCGPCNKALGLLADDPARLARALTYLNK